MSNHRGHLMGGVVAYVAGCLAVLFFAQTIVTSPFVGVEWLLCALAGALFPDVDIKSKGQKYFYALLLVMLLLLILCGRVTAVMVLSVLSTLPLLVKHRGIFHKAWFAIGVPIAAAYVLCGMWPSCSRAIAFDALFFVAGIASHLILDKGWSGLLEW